MTSTPQDLQWVATSNAANPAIPLEPLRATQLRFSKASYLLRVARDWLARNERLSASEEYSIRELLSVLLDTQ